MNKKILLIGPKPSDDGGIARWSSIYIKYLESCNCECFCADTTPQVDDKKRMNIIYRIISSMVQMRRTIKMVKKILRNSKIDIAHILTSASLGVYRDRAIIKLLKKKKTPIVYHFHFGTFKELYLKKSLIFKILIKNSKKCDAVICIDKTTYSIAKTLLNNVEYIPNPVVLEFTEKKKKNQIVFAGHVRENKGVSELLEAWPYIFSKNPDWELLIIGEIYPPYLEMTHDKYLKSLNVSFFGKLPHNDLQQILNESSIFVLPSYFEGCPNVILEAMCNNMAIVATNVGGIPDLISDCGILISPKSANEITEGITTYINNREKLLEDSEKAFNKVKESFSQEVICCKYLDLYENIIKE